MSDAPSIRELWEEANTSALYAMAPEFTIRQTADGWEVCQRDGRSVYPSCVKATKEGAAARLLQLLGIATSIAPQTWPERVCIGHVVERPSSDEGNVETPDA